MRVLVIGGGIGGLALAAGLRRNGIDVTIHERDTDLSATGGYHITLYREAQRAFAELAGPDIAARLMASAADGNQREPDALFDHLARPLGPLLPADSDRDRGIDVDRVTLRLLLAGAAGGSLRLGRTFTGYTHGHDGTVMGHFDDGSTVTADVLVGADGARSVVARQLAGVPTNQPTGLTGVSGRTLRADLEPGEQHRLGIRSSFAVGPRGTALYVGYLDPVGHAVTDAPALRSAVTTDPTYIWGAMVPDSAGHGHLRGYHGGRLRDAVTALLHDRGWDERSAQIIARTDPSTVALYRFHAASTDPDDLAPWPAGNVTALGDAVHATPPTAGMGAGIALQDAADLCRRITSSATGTTPLVTAVAAFEDRMRERGAAALRMAMETVDRVLRTADDDPATPRAADRSYPAQIGTSGSVGADPRAGR